MFETMGTGRPQMARPALGYARRIGATRACLASALVLPGWARGEDGRMRKVARIAGDGPCVGIPDGIIRGMRLESP
jgi:hypothetical protein